MRTNLKYFSISYGFVSDENGNSIINTEHLTPCILVVRSIN